jgi:hypothetical protein
MKSGKLRVLACLILYALAAAVSTSTGTTAPTAEVQVKTAFVYNFVKFVQWPPTVFPSDETPIVLCVLGDDPLGNALESLKGKTAQGRRIEVRQISKITEIRGCQIVYVCRSEREHKTKIITEIKPYMLTVGDMPSFVSAGGMINLILSDNRVAFEINVAAADKSGLKISSQLLKLARIARGSGGRGVKP